MVQLPRRSVLHGSALALATIAAGCTGSSERDAGTNEGIPGVEDGKITDTHELATAHSDQLANRSGTVKWTKVSLDPETSNPETYALLTVRVEGGRVHAAVTGRTSFSGTDADRLEFYYGEDTSAYRKRINGEWKMGEKGQLAINKGKFTGRSTLESASLSKIGTETAYGETLYRFSNVESSPDSERLTWTSVQALIGENGLGYNFERTLAGNDTRRVDEWHLRNLNETTVQRPDWVEK